MVNKCLNTEKAIAAFSIIFIHCVFPSYLGIIMCCLARFAVPLFFLTSGYYFYHMDPKILQNKVPKKLIHIGKLIILSQLLSLVLSVIIKIKQLPALFASIFNLRSVINLIVFNRAPLAESTWFLFALLYCYILAFLVSKFNLYRISYVSIPILLTLQIIFDELLSHLNLSSENYLTRNFIFIGFPFFMLGNFIHKHEKHLINRLNNPFILLLIAVSGFTTLYERHISKQHDLYISSIFTACLLFIFALKNSGFALNNTLEKIGRNYSLGIYIVHPIILRILSTIDHDLHMKNTVYFYCKPILVLIMTTFFVVLFYTLKNKLSTARYPLDHGIPMSKGDAL